MHRYLLAAFAFTGVAGRLLFAAYTLVSAALLLALGFGMAIAFDLTVVEGESSLPWEETAPGLLWLGLGLWILTSLSATRLRDMGAPVLAGLALLTLAAVVDELLLRVTETRLPEPLAFWTPLGAALSLGSLAWLLFWPGQDRREAPPAP